MHFVVIAYDQTDDTAAERRIAVREAHLEGAKKFFASGQWIYAVGILDDDSKAIGSVIVCDFESREELDDLWLKHEPYITGEVWGKVDVNPAFVPPFCLPQ